MSKRSEIPYWEKERRGQAIYDAQIRHLIGPADEDKYVLVDILTGDYEIDHRAAPARIKLRALRPDAVILTMRRHQPYVGRLRSPRFIVHWEREPAAQ